MGLDIEVVELKPGDKLFSTGDPIDPVHYVIHGCFSRFDDGGKHLDEEESGSWLEIRFASMSADSAGIFKPRSCPRFRSIAPFLSGGRTALPGSQN